jgi:uncharacterized protein
MRRLFISFVLLGSIWAAQSTHAQEVPKLTSLVYDETSSLSPHEVTVLTNKLRAFEDSTTAQVAIMIVDTLHGYPASDFAVKAGNVNKLGQKGKDNGVLVLLSIEDREWFIATGYGMEQTITDPEAARIGRELLVPELKKGNYFAGLDATVEEIFREIKSVDEKKE